MPLKFHENITTSHLMIEVGIGMCTESLTGNLEKGFYVSRKGLNDSLLDLLSKTRGFAVICDSEQKPT